MCDIKFFGTTPDFQMLDMVRPATPGCVTLRDLKACKLTPYFFNTFFNLEKYLEQEQRDPFANVKVGGRQGAQLMDPRPIWNSSVIFFFLTVSFVILRASSYSTV